MDDDLHKALGELHDEVLREVEALGGTFDVEGPGDIAIGIAKPLGIPPADRARIAEGIDIVFRLRDLFWWQSPGGAPTTFCGRLVRECTAAQRWLDDPATGSAARKRQEFARSKGFSANAPTYRQEVLRLVCLLREFARVVKAHPRWSNARAYIEIGKRYSDIVKPAGVASDRGKELTGPAVQVLLFRHLPKLYPDATEEHPARHFLTHLRQAVAAGTWPE